MQGTLRLFEGGRFFAAFNSKYVGRLPTDLALKHLEPMPCFAGMIPGYEYSIRIITYFEADIDIKTTLCRS